MLLGLVHGHFEKMGVVDVSDKVFIILERNTVQHASTYSTMTSGTSVYTYSSAHATPSKQMNSVWLNLYYPASFPSIYVYMPSKFPSDHMYTYVSTLHVTVHDELLYT